MRSSQPDRLSAGQRAYAYIWNCILDGKLESNSFIEEKHISALIGVSRTPLREAFNRLQAGHLIELLPRCGARVRSVTLREMFEFYEVRRVIESHVARQRLWLTSAHSRACGLKRPRGSRSSSQRIVRTGMPAWRHTAVPETSSTRRLPSPCQPGTIPGL